MRYTKKPVHRSALAVLALGAGLTLAACGGDGDETPIAPPPGDDVVETPEETETDDADETETDTDDTSGTDDTDTGDTDTDATDDADPDDTATGGDGIQIDWPEGWEDLSEATGIPDSPMYQEVHAFGDPTNPTFAGNVTIIRYAAGMWGSGSGDYLELLELSGLDTSIYSEAGEREIDGRSVMGYDSENDYGAGPVQQRAYGFEHEDGSYVEIVLSANPADFDSYQQDFDQVLDSVQID